MRPTLDIEQVATGEHWYGTQAQEKGLVDEVGTSDDLLLNLMEGRELVGCASPDVSACSTVLPIARQKARIACCYAGCSADKSRCCKENARQMPRVFVLIDRGTSERVCAVFKHVKYGGAFGVGNPCSSRKYSPLNTSTPLRCSTPVASIPAGVFMVANEFVCFDKQ